MLTWLRAPNVYPREIEEVLRTHPEVSLAPGIDVPHEEHGEEVKAFVILAGRATLSEEQLVDRCKANMRVVQVPADRLHASTAFARRPSEADGSCLRLGAGHGAANGADLGQRLGEVCGGNGGGVPRHRTPRLVACWHRLSVGAGVTDT